MTTDNEAEQQAKVDDEQRRKDLAAEAIAQQRKIDAERINREIRMRARAMEYRASLRGDMNDNGPGGTRRSSVRRSVVDWTSGIDTQQIMEKIALDKQRKAEQMTAKETHSPPIDTSPVAKANLPMPAFQVSPGLIAAAQLAAESAGGDFLTYEQAQVQRVKTKTLESHNWELEKQLRLLQQQVKELQAEKEAQWKIYAKHVLRGSTSSPSKASSPKPTRTAVSLQPDGPDEATGIADERGASESSARRPSEGPRGQTDEDSEREQEGDTDPSARESGASSVSSRISTRISSRNTSPTSRRASPSRGSPMASHRAQLVRKAKKAVNAATKVVTGGVDAVGVRFSAGERTVGLTSHGVIDGTEPAQVTQLDDHVSILKPVRRHSAEPDRRISGTHVPRKILY